MYVPSSPPPPPPPPRTLFRCHPVHLVQVMEMPALPCGQPVFSALEKVSDETHPLCLMALTSCGSIYVMYLQTHTSELGLELQLYVLPKCLLTDTNAETIITIMQVCKSGVIHVRTCILIYIGCTCTVIGDGVCAIGCHWNSTFCQNLPLPIPTDRGTLLLL